MSNTVHVSHNSGNNDWFTPSAIVEIARTVLGEIDLDPASCAEANRVVQAKVFYTAETDGLLQPWMGRIWMNPPYAQPLITKFCEKLIEGHCNGVVTESITLVNNATETKWFQILTEGCVGICFPKSRVRFTRPNGGTGAPLQGQALIYRGQNVARFIHNFTALGLVVLSQANWHVAEQLEEVARHE
jgi:hypothetical protein